MEFNLPNLTSPELSLDERLELLGQWADDTFQPFNLLALITATAEKARVLAMQVVDAMESISSLIGDKGLAVLRFGAATAERVTGISEVRDLEGLTNWLSGFSELDFTELRSLTEPDAEATGEMLGPDYEEGLSEEDLNDD